MLSSEPILPEERREVRIVFCGVNEVCVSCKQKKSKRDRGFPVPFLLLFWLQVYWWDLRLSAAHTIRDSTTLAHISHQWLSFHPRWSAALRYVVEYIYRSHHSLPSGLAVEQQKSQQ